MIKTNLNFVTPNNKIQPRVTYSGTNIGQSYNQAYKMYEVEIENARSCTEDFRLHKNGFEKITHSLTDSNFESDTWIENELYKDVENLVKAASGASHVFIFDHTIRRGINDSLRKPAQHVHVDYTHNTGPARAEQMIDSEKLKALQGKRFIQVNFWRSVKGPVEQMPLAFLDSRTLDEDDLTVAEIAFTDTKHIGEIYAVNQNDDQRWYYYPDMQENEALLIKGYDTDNRAISRFTPHSAFVDPTSKSDAAPRQSIEVRTFAFFD